MKVVCLPPFFLLTMSSVGQTAADTIPPRVHHSVFVDLGGLAPPLSVNYTASFRLGGSWKLMGRTGFTYYLLGKPRSYLIPLEAGLLYGHEHHAEAAVGYTMIYSTYGLGRGTSVLYDPSPVLTLHLGYRWEPERGGFFVRVGIIVPMEVDPSAEPDVSYPTSKSGFFAIGGGYTF